jgi:hypothetical protein
VLPLVGLYPACPLAPLCADRTSSAEDLHTYLGDFRRMLAGLFDKATKVNGFFGYGELQSSAWARYFWKRGLEIDACVVRSTEDEQERT